MNEQSEDLGFHYRGGFHAKRLDDGSVRLTLHGSDLSIRLFQVTVDPDGWASLVSSVSALGEEDGRFYTAQKFHMEA